MKYCPNCTKKIEVKKIDGKNRFQCSDKSCGYIYWNNPIPVVGIIVETGDGIVLAHNKRAPKGIFSIITGFLEADEHPEAAAVRETMEELGLSGLETRFMGIFPFPLANQIIIAYHIKAEGKVVLNEELDEIKIVHRDDLNGYAESGKFEIQKWLNELRVLKK